jgi:hypothetical protein
MKTLDPSLDFILERGRDTKAVMDKLAGPPHNWTWTGVSPDDFGDKIASVDAQIKALADAEAATTAAAAHWDQQLDSLLEAAALGLRLGRVKFKEQPIKLRLFEGLRTNGTGRDARYKQALDFEAAWEKADPTWQFKPTLTLAVFKTNRLAITGLQEAHVAAEKHEQHERAYLHSLAEAVNQVNVDWYEVATATFGEKSVAGQLVRTIPTTYDPNRPPSQLVFTESLTPAPSQAQVSWRAARGERFYISAQAPGAAAFELILNGTAETEWTGQRLAAGLWRFKGYASNQFGNGPESDVVELTVAVAAAA